MTETCQSAELEALRKRLHGKLVIASVSGGKDSAAMCLFLQELGINHERVFMDTGWEHPDTYAYLRGPLTAALGQILEIKAPLQMTELIRKKGMFPSRRMRWCTDELKFKPMRQYISNQQDLGADVVNAVGIRSDESIARSRYSMWEWSDGYDCEVWRPILKWTETAVVEIHRRHGLVPNPLYLRGARRVGCWPCINSCKSEIKLISEIDKPKIEEIAELEELVSAAQLLRKSARGQQLVNRPGFFQAPIGRTGECWPINKIVDWANTCRGGREEDRQQKLFPDHNDGCMRWGLCDSLSSIDDGGVR